MTTIDKGALEAAHKAGWEAYAEDQRNPGVGLVPDPQDNVAAAMTAAITAYLASAPSSREAPKVKALVWRVPSEDRPRDPDTEDNALCADGLGGVYAISKKQTVGPERLLWWAHDPFDWKGFNSIAEAKEAAQNDFANRIRSQLE